MSDNLNEKFQFLEKKNRLISDQLIDAIWVVDADTLTFDYITPSIERISGYRAEEYIGRSIKNRLTDNSFSKIKPLIEKGIAIFEQNKMTTQTMEVELNHKSGNTYWAEIRAKLVKDQDGASKIVGVTRNISEHKAIEKKLKNMVEKLKKTIEEKEKLVKEVKILRGLLPICSGCKRIRDENGKWWPLDMYVKTHTGADLTHTICLDCKDVFYGDIA